MVEIASLIKAFRCKQKEIRGLSQVDKEAVMVRLSTLWLHGPKWLVRNIQYNVL